MWLRIGSRYPVRNLREELVSIRVHGTGSFRGAERMEENQWKVYEAALARWPAALDAVTRRRMRALILADAGGAYVYNRNDMARRRYFSSLVQWPFDRRRWFKLACLVARPKADPG